VDQPPHTGWEAPHDLQSYGLHVRHPGSSPQVSRYRPFEQGAIAPLFTSSQFF
jgi:hypothetical protein